MMTGAGVIMGTAGYMSPEQAKGRTIDKRSDIWAFGCVLYEMLTGSRAFEGEDVTDTLALILKGEPDWRRLPADTPPAVRALLRRCLEKDRRDRTVDATAAIFVLKDPAALSPVQSTPDPAHVRSQIMGAKRPGALLRQTRWSAHVRTRAAAGERMELQCSLSGSPRTLSNNDWQPEPQL
jgi:serine/threonine protein kinase